MEYAVVYENLFHTVKYADVILETFYENRQRNLLEYTIFQGYLMETILDEFKIFFSTSTSLFVQEAWEKLGELRVSNGVQQFEIS